MHPIAGVGAIVINNDQVLLVKRGNPPKQGLWCIPGGKIHFGESLQQAAEREIMEETGITIKAGRPVYAFDLIQADKHTHYVIVDVLADYVRGEIRPGDDASDVAWFQLADIDKEEIDTETRALIQQIIQGSVLLIPR